MFETQQKDLARSTRASRSCSPANAATSTRSAPVAQLPADALGVDGHAQPRAARCRAWPRRGRRRGRSSSPAPAKNSSVGIMPASRPPTPRARRRRSSWSRAVTVADSPPFQRASTCSASPIRAPRSARRETTRRRPRGRRPRCPSRRRRRPCGRRRRAARAARGPARGGRAHPPSAPPSPAGDSSALSPWARKVRKTSISEATTGSPAASASSATRPKPSFVEGNAKRSAAR